MILEGTFYSYRETASAVMRQTWYLWPFQWLPHLAVSGKYSPGDYIGKINCPELFIHSKQDGKVPFSQGKKLYETASEPKEFWELQSGHIDAFGALRGTYGPRLLEYLKNIK